MKIAKLTEFMGGDVVIGDNSLSLHHAPNDFDGTRRLIYPNPWRGSPPV
ncbi:MAG: hypothetical protein WBB25_04595 [Sulfitobacter sp.]